MCSEVINWLIIMHNYDKLKLIRVIKMIRMHDKWDFLKEIFKDKKKFCEVLENLEILKMKDYFKVSYLILVDFSKNIGFSKEIVC